MRRNAASAVAALAFVLAGLMPVHNPDTFGHLAQGRQIAAIGGVPSHDTFSFWQPATARWRNYEWLSDLLSYELYAAGGPTALILAKCLCLALCSVLLVRLAGALAGTRAAWLACALLVPALTVLRVRFTERPHVLGFVLLALYCTWAVSLWRAPSTQLPRYLAVFAAAHVAWVNLHGSHLLGLLVVASCLVWNLRDAALRKRFALVLGVQLLASCVSPYGPYIVLDALGHVADPAYRNLVTEWQPWQPQDSLWFLLMPSGATLLLVLLVRPIAGAHPAAKALLSVTLVLAVAASRSLRFSAEFLLLGAPLLAAGAAQLSAAVSQRLFAYVTVGWLTVCALLVPRVLAELPPYMSLGVGQSGVRLPVGAGHWLAHNARAPRVLAAMADGWYLMFAAPNAKLLVDGRAPFYGPEHLKRVQRALQERPQLTALLEQYRVNAVVVRHAYAGQRVLLATMRSHPSFVLVDVEDRYATFVRRTLAIRGNSRPKALVLEPGYSPDALLTADDRAASVLETELKRLPSDEAHAGYVAFVRAMLSLRTVLRDGGRAGLRTELSEADTATLREAATLLERASRGADGVPVVDAYLSLVLVSLCELDRADKALGAATREGGSREAFFAQAELMLRREQLSEVRALVEQARADMRSAGDPWLEAIEAGLQAPPSCAH